MEINWLNVLLYIFILISLFIYVKLSSIKINGVSLIKLHWRILLAIFFPVIFLKNSQEIKYNYIDRIQQLHQWNYGNKMLLSKGMCCFNQNKKFYFKKRMGVGKIRDGSLI